MAMYSEVVKQSWVSMPLSSHTSATPALPKASTIAWRVWGNTYGSSALSAILSVNAIRAELRQDPILEVPCIVKDYANDLSREIDNIALNNGITQGLKEVGFQGFLAVAAKMYTVRAAIKAEMQRELCLKPGTGQKVFNLCKVDGMHPTLNIIKNVLDGVYPWGPIAKEALRKCIVEAWSEEVTLEYFETLGLGGNKPKIMSARAIAECLAACKCKVVAQALQGILNNDKTEVLVCNTVAKEVNEFVDALTK